MPSVLRWRDGLGWIILAGGGDIRSTETGEVEATALGRTKPGDPIAYIWAAGDVETADTHLDLLEDLGGPTGYLVDVLTEDDDTLRKQVSIAGLIIIGDGPNIKGLRSGLLGAAQEAMITAYEQGALIMGIGNGAAVLGSLVENQPGLAWVEKAIIVPAYDTEDGPPKLRDQLLRHPESYGLGLRSGSAVALGPDGKIEAWGTSQPTIMLGSSFT
jgi:hypothetical protein